MSAATPPDAGAGPGQNGPGEPAGPGRAGSGPAWARAWRHRWARAALVVLAVAVIVTVVILDRHALGQSVSALGSLDLRWFALAVLFEIGRASCRERV